MRFNSHEFIFFFLPATWAIWLVLHRAGGARWGAAWLILASLVFYSWWDWHYTPLLAVSLLFNFAVGRRLVRTRPNRSRHAWLVAGLVWNLGALGYFKYWNFFVENVDARFPAALPLAHVILPLGISFFTFQKIAFLVDAWRGEVSEVHLRDFSLFVLFFPQLIAGPIVHHRDFIPQVRDARAWRLTGRQLALGLTVFIAGLFQKCVVADTLAPMADTAFGLAANGATLRMQEAWTGLAAYALQLLYDFSGYSHMALGLALLFGLRLPINFLAPYTSRSLVEFWHRWHITLSTFLRDYVYIPLGGNRCGWLRHLWNLFFTLVLGGLWHGAGWTFILWGAWHGAALAVNHLWRNRHPAVASPPAGGRRRVAHAGVLLVVGLGWVLFRAADLTAARAMAASLLGLNGISVPVAWMSLVRPLAPVVRPRGLFPNITATPAMLALLVAAGALACRGPRLLRWLGVTPADVTGGAKWQAAELAPPDTRLDGLRAVAAGVMFALALAGLAQSSPFLYFQF